MACLEGACPNLSNKRGNQSRNQRPRFNEVADFRARFRPFPSKPTAKVARMLGRWVTDAPETSTDGRALDKRLLVAMWRTPEEVDGPHVHWEVFLISRTPEAVQVFGSEVHLNLFFGSCCQRGSGEDQRSDSMLKMAFEVPSPCGIFLSLGTGT